MIFESNDAYAKNYLKARLLIDKRNKKTVNRQKKQEDNTVKSLTRLRSLKPTIIQLWILWKSNTVKPVLRGVYSFAKYIAAYEET